MTSLARSCLIVLALCLLASPAAAQAECFVGEVRMFAGNFAPRNWALCDGQEIAINDNQALFSILGTTYGGDGRTNYKLPDLRGRVPVHPGSAPGLSTHALGERFGAESSALTTNELPAHSHELIATQDLASQTSPAGALLATKTRTNVYAPDVPAERVAMAPAAIGATGSGQAMSRMQPALGINYIICLTGTFPSRN